MTLNAKLDILCADCFYCWKRVFQSGKYLEMVDEVWKCSRKPSRPTIHFKRTVRGRVIEEKTEHVKECPLYSPEPWKHSEKFAEWERLGISFRRRRGLLAIQNKTKSKIQEK